MSLRENLKEIGWHLSQEGIETVCENEQIQDVNILSKKALDFDLRDIGDAALPEDFTKDPSKLEKPVVVQIQKIRNVSAPKANEESTSAPRMLKLTLHDGKTTCTGLEISPISSLSINTPPGTKLLLKNEGLEVCHGVIWLSPSVFTVLGGKVSHMIEKWELNRSLAKHTRGGIDVDGGPPPWIPFGQHLEAQTVDKQFKSLQEATKQDNAEFEAQRKGAIAEAQRLSGIKKIFGGGTKPLLDANVQKIVDAGFSEEQAENALKYTKNNVDRALKILQKRDNSENRSKEKPAKESDQPKRKGRNKDANDEDGIPVKPSGKVSLFDFLEDKLPNVPDKEKNNRQYNPNAEDRGDRNYQNRDKNSAKSNPRSQGPRYDGSNRHRPENRGHYSNDNAHTSHREDRKYQSQNEKPPRFQKKLEEKNKQQQQQHTSNSNMSMNIPYSNSYHNQPQQQPMYNERNMRNERNLSDNNKMQHNYRGNANPMDSLVDATVNLNLLSNQSRPEEVQVTRAYQQHAEPAYPPKQSYAPPPSVDMPPFRRNSEMPKYQDQAYQRRQQPNGYMEAQQPMYPNVGYMGGAGGAYAGRYAGYGTRAQEFGPVRGGGPFLPGSLLGFQNAAVNEQARAMLGVAEINWKVGDRCLALYWEDNNVAVQYLSPGNVQSDQSLLVSRIYQARFLPGLNSEGLVGTYYTAIDKPFYEAEITGISANTVVVKFCAYGNHEEILKSNCLPFPNQGVNHNNGGYNMTSRGGVFARRP